MTAELMDPSLAGEYASALPTVPHWNLGAAPSGYRAFGVSRVVPGVDVAGATEDLFAWRVHTRAGLHVVASDIPLREGTVVQLRLRLGPVPVSAPCRVVEVVEQEGRRGFTNATLHGHPESGVERFLLTSDADGVVTFTLEGWSRPATWPARAAAPIARAVQRMITRRYLASWHSPGA